MEREQLKARLAEDLGICEEYLKKEARLDLVLRILEELLNEIEELKKNNISLEEVEERAKLLYHRATTLVTLNEEEAKK